jgi:hypothetical protein
MEDSGPNLIDLGCYEKYLRPFLDTFGPDRVFIMYFEELKSNPRDEMQRLSQFLGIDKSFYGTYNFNIHNPTVNYKYSWMNKFYMDMEPRIASLRTRIIHYPFLNRSFEIFINNGKNLYRSINKGRQNEQDIFPPEILENLRSYYRSSNDALSQLTNRPLPWKSFET